MKSIVLVSLLMILMSCTSTSSIDGENVKDDWCSYLTKGTFEGQSNDGITANLEFKNINQSPYYNNSDGFIISYQFPNDKRLVLEGGSKIVEFFEYGGKPNDIELKKPIKLKPHGISFGQEHLNNTDVEFGEIRVTYMSGDKVKLDFPKINKILKKLNSSFSDIEGLSSIILEKKVGIKDCIDFDPKASFSNFSDHEKNFILSDLEYGESWELADKELMLDYLLRKPQGYAWGAWNKSLEGIGSVFKLDLNADDEQDIAGYFSHKNDKDKKLVFKIFLNNGVSYQEGYSKNISNYGGGDEVFFPDSLNGKPIIRSSYLDTEGYSLFYNKLTGKVEGTNGDVGSTNTSIGSNNAANTETSSLMSYGEIRAELINSKNPNAIENLLGEADEEYSKGKMTWYIYYFKAQRNGAEGHLKCTYKGIWGGQVDGVEFYTPGSKIRIGAQYLVSPKG